MSNELQVTKEQTAQFVHDVMEMEKSIFTLDRAMADCEKKKKKILDEASKKVEKAKSQKDKAEKDVEEVNDEIKEKSSFSPYYFWEIFFIVLFCGGSLIMALIVGLVGGLIYVFWDVSLSETAIPLAIVALIITVLWAYLSLKRDMKGQIIHNECEIEKLERRLIIKSEKLGKAQNEYENTLLEQNRAIESAKLLDAQKKQLKENRDAISRSLKTCYETNIIKPKYRNIECVIIMNELYQNDRVDTMREAMDKCEERLFRDGVNAKLGQMVTAWLKYLQRSNPSISISV